MIDRPSVTAAAPQFPPAALQSVEAYRNASEPGLEALLEALQDLRSFHEALRGFAESLDLGADVIAEDTYRLIVDVLGWNLVRLRYPRLYFIMQARQLRQDITSPFPGEGRSVSVGKTLLPVSGDRGLEWVDTTHCCRSR
jgi:hypothetical protein